MEIAGSQGLLISNRTGELNAVLWRRGERLYAIAGELSRDEVLAAANGVQYP